MRKVAKKQYVGYLVVLILAFLVYWPGLGGPLILDDGPQLLPIINDLGSIGWSETFRQHVLSNSGALSRPVSMATFVLNAVLNGSDFWYWKLSNVVLHITCGAVIYFLTTAILSINQQRDCKAYKFTSLLISFIWIVHPLQVSTVLYLVQRMAILSAVFMFAALYCYVIAMKRELSGRNGTIPFVFSICFFFPLSIFSKETGLLYPLFIILIDSLFSRNLSGLSNIGKLKKKVFLSINYLIIVIGVIAFLFFQSSLLGDGYNFRDFTLLERLLTEPRVLVMYLTQILFPMPSLMGFFHDDFVISRSFLDPVTTPFAIALVLVAVMKSLYWVKRGEIFAFGVAFFFISHTLESTALPLEIAFEHRNYTGLWGITLALVLFMTQHLKKGIVGVVSIAVVIFCVNIYRVSIWGDPNRMYPHMFAAHPKSSRLKSIFSSTYSNAGLYAKAYAVLEGEASLGAGLQRLEIECIDTGEFDDGALTLLLEKTGNKIAMYEMEGIITLANLGLDDKCAIDDLEFVSFIDEIMLLPIVNNVAEQKLLLYKAHYQHKLEKFDDAISTLSSSWNKDISNPVPLFLQVDWLFEQGNYEKAQITFEKAEKIALSSWYDYSEFVDAARSKLN